MPSWVLTPTLSPVSEPSWNEPSSPSGAGSADSAEQSRADPPTLPQLLIHEKNKGLLLFQATELGVVCHVAIDDWNGGYSFLGWRKETRAGRREGTRKVFAASFHGENCIICVKFSWWVNAPWLLGFCWSRWAERGTVLALRRAVPELLFLSSARSER